MVATREDVMRELARRELQRRQRAAPQQGTAPVAASAAPVAVPQVRPGVTIPISGVEGQVTRQAIAPPQLPMGDPRRGGLTREQAQQLPAFSMPTAQTGAFLQDQLVRGLTNFASLPGASRDLVLEVLDRTANALGLPEVDREAIRNRLFRTGGAATLVGAAPANVLGELQSLGIDPLTGAQPQSTAEIVAGDILEGAASFPPAALPAAAGAAVGRAGARGIENIGGGETAQLVTEIGLGALAGGGAQALRELPAALANRPPAIPELQQLRDRATQAFQRAENAGVVVSRPAFAQFVNRVANRVAEEGIDRTLHPRASAALNRLVQTVQQGAPTDLNRLQILRRIAQGAGRDIANPDEGRIAGIITQELDDFVSNLGPTQVVAGRAAEASAALREGRQLWSRLRKGEIIDDLVERARNRSSQFTGSGFENALRTEFRGLIQNPRRLRGFTRAEQAALRRVARGGPVGNLARFFGRFAPVGPVSGAITAGGGAAIAGPVGAAVAGGMGFGGRGLAEALTMRNVNLAGQLIRGGGQVSPGEALRQALVRQLQIGGTAGTIPAVSQ